MADIHIDDFCRDAARVLLHVYGAFPRRTSVYVEDIAGPDEPDDVGLHSERHMACLGTMLWLAEEGYIRYEAMVYQDGIDQAVLTGRSFTLLSSVSDVRYESAPPDVPAVVAVEKMTLVEQIRAALRSGESRKVTAIMRYLLSSPVTGSRLPDVPMPDNPEGCAS